MTNKSKNRGTAWETAVCRFLAAEGFPHVERRALNGTQDRGDIAGIPGWVLEAKNCQRTELAGWVDGAALEQANDGAAFSAVWHHRRMKASPADGFVTMSGATFVRLLRQAGYGEPPPSDGTGPAAAPISPLRPERVGDAGSGSGSGTNASAALSEGEAV